MAAYEENHQFPPMIEGISKLYEKQLDFESVCDWFKYFSFQTWEKLRFAYHHSAVKMHETTITQDLVFTFWRLAGLKKLPVMMLESEDEKANGNDLEIIIETNKRYIILPIQAKIIKKNYRYSTINHKNSNGYQIDLLIDYARKKKGLPLYLFYNYCDDFYLANKIADKAALPKELFGCSIAEAYRIKAQYCYSAPKGKKSTWILPDFSSIHTSLAFPFHYLACNDFYNWHDQIELQKAGGSLKLYTVDELLADTQWKNMFPGAKIGFIPEKERRLTDDISENESQASSFNPKFRMIISMQKLGSKLVRMS